MLKAFRKSDFRDLPKSDISRLVFEALRQCGVFPEFTRGNERLERFIFQYSYRLSVKVIVADEGSGSISLWVWLYDHRTAAESPFTRNGQIVTANSLNTDAFLITIGEEWPTEKPKFVFVKVKLEASDSPETLAVCLIKMARLLHLYCG